MAALASPSDLGAFLNTLIDVDDARAVLVLRIVSGAVCQAAGSASDEWEVGSTPDDVLGVVLSAAARMWENPTGASQIATGPFSAGWRDGGILTGDEREQVAAYNTAGVSGLSSIRVQAPARAAASRILDEWYDQLIESDEGS